MKHFQCEGQVILLQHMKAQSADELIQFTLKLEARHSEDRVTTLAEIFLSIFSKTPGTNFSKIA